MNHIERTQAEWSNHAGEQITVELVGGTLYAFGSELAMLRLYRQFCGHGRVGFSANLETWYFTPET